MLRRSVALLCVSSFLGLIGCSSSFSVHSPEQVVISLAPATATNLLPGETEQFTATVSNASNGSIIWEVDSIVGGNSTVGTISATGLYTAPGTVSATTTFTITAAAAANTSASATETVTVAVAPTVTISPAQASVYVNATQKFTVSLGNTNDSSVTWQVNGVAGGNSTFGTISSAGIYTAPASVPASSSIVSVQAVSTADPTIMGTASVTILPLPPQVIVTPSTASVPGNTTQQFTASVKNTTNTAVTWEVNDIPGGNPSVGTISQTGLYTAPSAIPSPAAVTVSAVSQADTSAVGSATVTVTTPEVVTVTPATASVALYATQQFTGASSIPSDTLTWQVNGVTGGDSTYGTITSDGLYTAPSTAPSNPIVVIKAISGLNPVIFGTATVSIGATTPSVTVTPATASVAINTPQDFSAAVRPSNLSQSVQWKVDGVAGGDATVGTISSSGHYVAPLVVPNPSQVTISAVSTALSNVFGTATVTVTLPSTPISVTVTPATATVIVGQGAQFSASVSPSNNTAVNWTVSSSQFGCTASASNACGSIDSTGNYTAPTSVPGGGQSATVTVTATSVADPTKSGTASVTIHPQPTPTISINSTSTVVCSTLSVPACSPTQHPTLTVATQNFPSGAQLQFNWTLGCVNADEDSDGCQDGSDGDNGSPDADGPGQIQSSSGGTAGNTVSNSASIVYLPPQAVYTNVVTSNGCTTPGSNTNSSWAYVPVTVSTVYNGSTYTSQPTCIQIIYQFQ